MLLDHSLVDAYIKTVAIVLQKDCSSSSQPQTVQFRIESHSVCQDRINIIGSILDNEKLSQTYSNYIQSNLPYDISCQFIDVLGCNNAPDNLFTVN